MKGEETVNVARFLALQAQEQPDGCAVLAPKGRTANGDIRYESICFGELHRQSGQVAHGLVHAGIGCGTRVLLMVRPGSDLIRCCFALFQVGAVPVVIDPGMGLRNFLACVRRSQPEALVGIPLAHWVRRAFPRVFRSVRSRVRVGRRFRKWFGRFPGDGYPVAASDPETLAAILFTSGSTGPPKGVCYGHGQFDAQVRMIRETFSIEPGEVDLPMLPIFALFNPALGMTTVVPEMNPARPSQVKPARILQAIRQCGVTNSFGSPVLWRIIAEHASRTGQRFPGMRRILMAGAAVPPDLVRKLQPHFPNARLWSPYGATECLPVAAVDGSTLTGEARHASASGSGTCVGLPVSGVEVRILKIEDRPLPTMSEAVALADEEIGEIVATGPSVTRSYDGLPDATARAKIRDETGRIWHRMGDAGYRDPDGRIWFCGRIAERVVTRNGVLYTDCVEGIINTMPGVRRSALIGLGPSPDQEPALVIEPETGKAPKVSEILQHAAEFEVTQSIKRVFFCQRFPVDVRHNAKIHRLELAKRFQSS